MDQVSQLHGSTYAQHKRPYMENPVPALHLTPQFPQRYPGGFITSSLVRSIYKHDVWIHARVTSLLLHATACTAYRPEGHKSTGVLKIEQP